VNRRSGIRGSTQTRAARELHAEQLSNMHGAALAASFQALSADHLEHLDDDGVRAMARAGTVAVLLPGAFYFCATRNFHRWRHCAPRACPSPLRLTAIRGRRHCLPCSWR
jgi:imidazolonepropionase